MSRKGGRVTQHGDLAPARRPLSPIDYPPSTDARCAAAGPARPIPQNTRGISLNYRTSTVISRGFACSDFGRWIVKTPCSYVARARVPSTSTGSPITR